MRRFFWRMAVADCSILEKSGRDSQYSYFVIGVLYAIIGLITFTGFFAMFFGVFDSIFSALIGAGIIGFLISNIYRLTLISLEPHTLPRNEPLGSMIFSYVLKYVTIFAFAFFVSKCFEMLIIDLIDLAIRNDNLSLMDYDGSSGYMEHMMESNQSKPWLWAITALIVLLFVSPIYMRHRLNRSHQYYKLKYRRDVRLVKERYNEYSEIMERLYRQLFENYSELADRKMSQNINSSEIESIRDDLRKMTFKSHEKHFNDYPFCTEPIVKDVNLSSSDEFMNHFDPDKE